MSRIILCAVLLALLGGCAQKETLYQIEPPPSTLAAAEGVTLAQGERWIAADTEVVEYDLACYDERGSRKAPFADGVFTSASEWRSAVQASGCGALTERLDRYGGDFFAANALCCCVETASAGCAYRIEGVSLREADGGKQLTLYVSYSDKGMMNHLSEYCFFAELNAADAADIVDVSVVKYSRG